MGPVRAWLVPFYVCSTFAAQVQKSVPSGQTAILPCHVRYSKNEITVVKWIRVDLKSEYVLLYRDDQSVLEDQHPSFMNRVDLQDGQMKDGNVSLIVKNVTTADNGTYECHIIRSGFVVDGRPFCTITLTVVLPGPPGGHTEDGSFGLSTGLSVSVAAVAVAVAGYFIYRKIKAWSSQTHQLAPSQA